MVEINEINFIEVKEKKNYTAIVSYWLKPPFASCHCWRKHYAIITNTNFGYTITNEEFLPESFNIESIMVKDRESILYCYDYDCAEHKELNHYKMTL